MDEKISRFLESTLAVSICYRYPRGLPWLGFAHPPVGIQGGELEITLGVGEGGYPHIPICRKGPSFDPKFLKPYYYFFTFHLRTRRMYQDTVVFKSGCLA